MSKPPLVFAAIPLALAVGACQSPLIYSTPAIDVALRSAPADMRLLLAYDDAGVEPLAEGPGRAVWHIGTCTVVDGKCHTAPTRLDLNLRPSGARTIQVRLFNGRGNPIVGGVRWDGVPPSQVSLSCDLAKPASSACRVQAVVS